MKDSSFNTSNVFHCAPKFLIVRLFYFLFFYLDAHMLLEEKVCLEPCVLGNSNTTHKVAIYLTLSLKGFYCGKLKVSLYNAKFMDRKQLQDALGFCISEAYDAFEIRSRETATSRSVDQMPSEGFCKPYCGLFTDTWVCWEYSYLKNKKNKNGGGGALAMTTLYSTSG